jgi:hypothetical protein
MDSIQCNPARAMVAGSARTTCSTLKFDHTLSSAETASPMRLALAARAAAFRAPADVPTSTSNGQGAWAGSQSAMARSTPTWYAARAPPPAKTKATVLEEDVVGFESSAIERLR